MPAGSLVWESNRLLANHHGGQSQAIVLAVCSVRVVTSPELFDTSVQSNFKMIGKVLCETILCSGQIRVRSKELNRVDRLIRGSTSE